MALQVRDYEIGQVGNYFGEIFLTLWSQGMLGEFTNLVRQNSDFKILVTIKLYKTTCKFKFNYTSFS